MKWWDRYPEGFNEGVGRYTGSQQNTCGCIRTTTVLQSQGSAIRLKRIGQRSTGQDGGTGCDQPC